MRPIRRAAGRVPRGDATVDGMAPAARHERAWLVWVALLTIYVVWGSTYLAIRVVVDTMPPLLSAGVRFALAGAGFWLALRMRGGARVQVTGRQVAGAALIGSLL